MDGIEEDVNENFKLIEENKQCCDHNKQCNHKQTTCVILSKDDENRSAQSIYR